MVDNLGLISSKITVTEDLAQNLPGRSRGDHTKDDGTFARRDSTENVCDTLCFDVLSYIEVSMTFRSDPQTLILSALSDGPKHGYAIVKTIKERSDGVFKLSEGQLYPLLQTMLQKGLVSANWETPESGPARKVYQLEPDGKKELEQKRVDWDKYTTAMKAMLKLPKPQVEGGNG